MLRNFFISFEHVLYAANSVKCLLMAVSLLGSSVRLLIACHRSAGQASNWYLQSFHGFHNICEVGGCRTRQIFFYNELDCKSPRKRSDHYVCAICWVLTLVDETAMHLNSTPQGMNVLGNKAKHRITTLDKISRRRRLLSACLCAIHIKRQRNNMNETQNANSVWLAPLKLVCCFFFLLFLLLLLLLLRLLLVSVCRAPCKLRIHRNSNAHIETASSLA